MKNIHVLPTDKPSRLYLTTKEYIFEKEYSLSTDECQNKHIYITSDEEIKDGDWFIYPLYKKGFDIKRYNPEKHFAQEPCISLANLKSKKIILTTDQDLIKDGVQAIDDEFLEWFVKNPTCKEVKVILSDVSFVIQDTVYKIIIPKEESTKCYCGHTTYCDCGPKEESKFVTVNIESATGEDLGKVSYISLPNLEYVPKQETLEEAAQKRFPIDLNAGFIERNCSLNATANYGFIEGAKWQAERMYSEEDMHKLMDEYQDYLFKTDEAVKTFKEWFEQFKKNNYEKNNIDTNISNTIY